MYRVEVALVMIALIALGFAANFTCSSCCCRSSRSVRDNDDPLITGGGDDLLLEGAYIRENARLPSQKKALCFFLVISGLDISGISLNSLNLYEIVTLSD